MKVAGAHVHNSQLRVNPRPPNLSDSPVRSASWGHGGPMVLAHVTFDWKVAGSSLVPTTTLFHLTRNFSLHCFSPPRRINGYPAMSKYLVAVGSIEGVVGSKHQVPEIDL